MAAPPAATEPPSASEPTKMAKYTCAQVIPIQTTANPRMKALRRGSTVPLRASLRGKNITSSNSKKPKRGTPVVVAISSRMLSKATTAIPPPRSTGIPQSKSASCHTKVESMGEGRTFLPRVEAVAIVYPCVPATYHPRALLPTAHPSVLTAIASPPLD